MAEADGEANYVWSAKMRIAVFFSAMRHFAETLRTEGYRLIYEALEADTPERSFSDVLGATLDRLQPKEVVMVETGRVARFARYGEGRQGAEFAAEGIPRSPFSVPD